MQITRRLALAGTLALSLTGNALAQTQTTIELWSFLDPVQDNARSKALKHVIDTFETANPSIKVKTSVIQWQEISPQLLRAARAGRVPDVVMIFSPQLQMQIAAGTLAPLDDRLAKMPDRSDLVVLSEGKDRKGATYAVPWEMRVSGIMYRKDLLEKQGCRCPRPYPNSPRRRASSASKAASVSAPASRPRTQMPASPGSCRRPSGWAPRC
jgi:multiple sugar transport system substrate-binding protein